MEFLASDAMRGRGSGTADELLAATYVASQLRAYGIAPAGRQWQLHSASRAATAKVVRPAPAYICTSPGWKHGEKITWTYGKEFIARHLSQTHFSGAAARAIQARTKTDPAGSTSRSIVLIVGSDVTGKNCEPSRRLASAGAVAAIEVAGAEEARPVSRKRERICRRCRCRSKGALPAWKTISMFCEVSPDAARHSKLFPRRHELSFDSSFTSEKKYTWNAVGILRGSDPKLARLRGVAFGASGPSGNRKAGEGR